MVQVHDISNSCGHNENVPCSFVIWIDDCSSTVQFIAVFCLLLETRSCSLLANHICGLITLLPYLVMYLSGWLPFVSLFSQFDLRFFSLVLPQSLAFVSSRMSNELSCSIGSLSLLLIVATCSIVFHRFLPPDQWLNLWNAVCCYPGWFS